MHLANSPRYPHHSRLPVQVTDCKTCGESFEYGHLPGYCSEACYWRAKGQSIKRQLSNDHRYCSSCFAKLKDIERPTESFLNRIQVENGEHTKQAIIGFQYLTPAARREHGYTYCQCGNVHTNAELRELQELNLADVLANLWRLLVAYYREGQFGDNQPSREVLFGSLRGSGLDWEYALGRGVYARE